MREVDSRDERKRRPGRTPPQLSGASPLFRAALDATMATAAMAVRPAARGPGSWPALPTSRPAACWISSKLPAEITGWAPPR